MWKLLTTLQCKNIKNTVELIMSKKKKRDKSWIIGEINSRLPDLTPGAFHVRFASDDGGTHIEISIDDHESCASIRESIDRKEFGYRCIILKCPTGYIQRYKNEDEKRGYYKD